jgi:hypothetical protein
LKTYGRLGFAAVLVLLLSLAAPSNAITASAASGQAAPVLHTRLHGVTVMQSFTYDKRHKRYYFAQVAGDRTKGNIFITKTTAGGRRLGWMRLDGFGHGLSIGVEPVGKRVYLWTEALARREVGKTGPMASGTAIARFRFRSGRTITSRSSGVHIFHDNPRSTGQSPYVDTAAGTIAVRYMPRGLGYPRFALYRLAAFKAHRYHAILRVDEPAQVRGTVFQGWSYAYDNSRPVFFTLDGHAEQDNTYISSFGANGRLSNRFPEKAGMDLPGQEPEGLQVVADHLCFGRASGQRGDRIANLFCKR